MIPLISPVKDAQLRLDMMRLQLNWLEQEMVMLRRSLNQPESPVSPPTGANFSTLSGVWAGVDISEEDFRASRLTLSENLP